MYFPVVAVDDGPYPSRHLQEYVPPQKEDTGSRYRHS